MGIEWEVVAARWRDRRLIRIGVIFAGSRNPDDTTFLRGDDWKSNAVTAFSQRPGNSLPVPWQRQGNRTVVLE